MILKNTTKPITIPTILPVVNFPSLSSSLNMLSHILLFTTKPSLHKMQTLLELHFTQLSIFEQLSYLVVVSFK